MEIESYKIANLLGSIVWSPYLTLLFIPNFDHFILEALFHFFRKDDHNKIPTKRTPRVLQSNQGIL